MQPGASATSATHAAPDLDLSGLVVGAGGGEPQRSVVSRAFDVLTQPVVSPETARRFVGAHGSLPDVSVLGTLWNIAKATPDYLLHRPPLAMLEDPIAQASGEVLRNAIQEPSTIPAMVTGALQGFSEGVAGQSDPMTLASALTMGATSAIRPALMRALRALPEAERAIVAARLAGNAQLVGQLRNEVQAARSQAEISRALLQTAQGVDLTTSGALAARGTYKAATAKTLSEFGQGVIEAGLGAAGVRNAPYVPARSAPVPLHAGELPAPRGYVATPSGVIVASGQPVPDTVVPDASFVRAEPAQYAQRDIRGALPPGPDFLVSPEGAAVPLSEAERLQDALSQLSRLDTPVPNGKRTAKVSTPAAVQDFSASGERVYSSDPTAASVRNVLLSDAERSEARRMLAEMENIGYTPRTFLRDEQRVRNIGGAPEVLGGAGGARVYGEILERHGRGNPTRADVIEGLQKTLKGEASAYGPAIRETARARLGGHLSAQLPPDAGDLPIEPGRMDEDDFSAFSEFVNRLAGDESGHLSAGLATRIGAGAAGGVIGAASGETPEERLQRGAVGAAAGLIAPSLLAREGGRAALPKIAAGRLAEETRAAGMTPDILDARVSGIAPATANRPVYRDPREATYERVFRQLGRRSGGIVEGETAKLPTTGAVAAEPKQLPRDPMANLDPLLGKYPPEYRDALKQVIADNGGFVTQRRGVVSQEETERLSRYVPVDVARMVKPGTAGNASAIKQHVDALASAMQRLEQVAQRVAAGRNADADLLELEQAKSAVQTLAGSVMSLRAEAGRSLGQWRFTAEPLARYRILSSVLKSANPELIAKAAAGIRNAGGPDLARQFLALPDDAGARVRWLQEQADKPSKTSTLVSYYLSNLLSGLGTQARNAAGNTFSLASHILAQPFAVGADVARSAIKGTSRTVYAGELPGQILSVVNGLDTGLKDAAFVLRYGLHRAELEGALSAAESGSKFTIPGARELPGGLTNPLNYGTRMLDAADALFRGIGRQFELFGGAYATARSEGLKDSASMQRRIAELMGGVSPEASAIQARADEFGRRAVFREENGPILQGLTAFATKVPAMRIAVPFFGFAGRSLKQGLEASALGFGMKAARAGERAGAQGLGRATLGSLLGGLFTWMAVKGDLVGAPPENRADRAQFFESGKQSNSIRLGGKWYSFQTFQPFSTQMQIIANAVNVMHRGKAPETWPQATFKTFMASLQSIADQSFMEGVNQLAETILHPERANIGKTIGRYASGFVPMSSFLRSVTRASDTTRRETTGALDTIAADIPGLSSRLPEQQDRFGNAITREGSVLGRTANPFTPTTDREDDRVLAFIRRLDLRVGYPTDNLKLPNGVTLSDDDRRALDQAKRLARQAAILKLDGNERFNALPLEVQQRRAGAALMKASEHIAARAKRLVKRREPLTIDALLGTRAEVQ